MTQVKRFTEDAVLVPLQILWKNKIFVFGGFYDTGHDVRYYNDAYLYDLVELKWAKLGDDKRGDNANW